MNSFLPFPYSTDAALFMLRFSLGIIFGAHGIYLLPRWKEKPSQKIPALILNTLRLLSILEPLGALAVIIGLLTVIPLIGFSLVMILAIPIRIKQGAPFLSISDNGWALDFILLLVCLSLLALGTGAFSVDHFIFIH
ncbi:MAG: hypothetical protein WCX28_06150 [Bacteriovoracaceae bacterium]|nr:hypothetical protein [Bacteroidota bacterium]